MCNLFILISFIYQQKLDYNWVETGHINTEYFVRALSWNLEGTRLLLGGRSLQLWTKSSNENQDDMYSKNAPPTATFHLGANYDDSEDEGKDRGRSSKEEDFNSPTSDGKKLGYICV